MAMFWQSVLNQNFFQKYFWVLIVILAGAGIVIGCVLLLTRQEDEFMSSQKKNLAKEIIKLPEPRYESGTSLEEALLERRSVRDYKDEPLTLAEISQLLWAAQGITEPNWGLRTAPSAGALYPLKIYVLATKVEGLLIGVYQYHPPNHELIKIISADKQNELYAAALKQSSVKEAAAVIIISAVYERTTQKYGPRGERYVQLEAGHAAQNIYLQAVSLDLGTVTIGAFDDDEVKKILNLPEEENPLYLMPVGKK